MKDKLCTCRCHTASLAKIGSCEICGCKYKTMKKSIKRKKRQQVLIIGGGNTFAKTEDYLFDLKNRKLNLERMRYQGSWKLGLQSELGEDFDVLLPQMPNSSNAYYEEWRITFDKIVPLLREHPILIGHSLGGIFLAKYLSEERCSVYPWAVILIAAPFDDETTESLGDFKFKRDPDIFAHKVYLIHSKDDPVVPFTELQKYRDVISPYIALVYNDKQHFNQATFPELVKLLKKLK